LVRCVLEFRCGWVGVVSVLQAELCAQHVSDINISIIRSLRLFCGITTLIVLFLVRCVLEFRCGWFGVVSVLQASASGTGHNTGTATPLQRGLIRPRWRELSAPIL